MQCRSHFAVSPVVDHHVQHRAAEIHDRVQLIFHFIIGMMYLKSTHMLSLVCALEIIPFGRGADGISLCPQKRDILHDNLPAHTCFFS